MNLLKSKLRRSTAVVAGTLIGLAGVAFFASPASAHHSVVKGTPTCDTATGDWTINWSVDAVGVYKAQPFKLAEVKVTPEGTIDGIKETEGPDFPFKSGEPVLGTQKVASGTESVTLAVKAMWKEKDGNWWVEPKPSTGTVTFDGTCTKDAPKPDAQLASSCDGVTVTLSNGKDAKKDAEFTIVGTDFTKNVTVKVGEEPVTVSIPAKNAGKVVVTEKSSDKPVLVGKWEEPKDCQQPEDNFEGGYQVTCDSLIFQVDNTKGKTTIEVTFTPNKGAAQTIVAKPGEKKQVTFKGEKGLEVTPKFKGEEFEAIKWDDEEKPAECNSASPSPSASASTSPAPAPGQGGGDDEETLPLTGAAAGGIAAGAAALLAAGAVLFILARRRKLKFTA
ncbi:cell wall anchor protein [Actinoplanes sp. NPDC000266]